MIINPIDGIEYRDGVLACIFGEDYHLPTPPPGFPRTYTLVCIDLYKIDTNTLYMIMVYIKAAIAHIYKTKKYHIHNNTIINSRFTLVGWNYIIELFDKTNYHFDKYSNEIMIICPSHLVNSMYNIINEFIDLLPKNINVIKAINQNVYKYIFGQIIICDD